MAAGSAAAKGALHLINWGKKIIPATADEIAEFGPNAARVKGLLSMLNNTSRDAARLSTEAYPGIRIFPAEQVAYKAGRRLEQSNAIDATKYLPEGYDPKVKSDKLWAVLPANMSARAEVVSDLITPEDYRNLTRPMAVGRRFDMTLPNAPEGFTNIARSLGERGLVQGPKDIEIARRVSMLPPTMQQVYLDLVGEGTDPMQLLKALRLMGQ